jgi:LacI family transcriptional regulator
MTVLTSVISGTADREPLSAVLYHDLRRDIHRGCQLIMQSHGALDGPIGTSPSSIQVITPFNLPADVAD